MAPARAKQITQFMSAIKRGDATQVNDLLRRDPALVREFDPDCFDANPVTLAVDHGDRAMIDLLLDHGADINAKSRWWAGGFTPLHAAVSGRHPDLAPYLMERGAEVDIHAAAGLGRTDRLAELLDTNPELIHARGGDGQFPLHYAATPEVAAFLLEHGAELEARDVDHESTAAQWAVSTRPKVCRYLIQQGARADIFMATALGDVDLIRAVLRDHPDALHARINEKTFPVQGSKALHIYGYTLGYQATPLHVAARCDQPSAIDTLIESGLDVNVSGEYDDCTPLHLAAWENRSGSARRLLQRGADIDRRSGSKHRNTPLGWAIVSGARDLVALLLSEGATALPHHVEDARDGQQGKFRQLRRVDPCVYTDIEQLLIRHCAELRPGSSDDTDPNGKGAHT